MFNSDLYNDRFAANLVKFVASDKFQTMFENYFLTYALEFTNDEEHKLRYYDLFLKFQQMFDEQLEVFCDSEGITSSEFMARCREASSNDPKVKRYIDILLSSVEYDTFVKLMKIMRPVAAAKAASTASDEKPMTSSSDAKGGGGGSSNHNNNSPSKAAKDIDDYEIRADSKYDDHDHVADSKFEKSEK